MRYANGDMLCKRLCMTRGNLLYLPEDLLGVNCGCLKTNKVENIKGNFTCFSEARPYVTMCDNCEYYIPHRKSKNSRR